MLWDKSTTPSIPASVSEQAMKEQKKQLESLRSQFETSQMDYRSQLDNITQQRNTIMEERNKVSERCGPPRADAVVQLLAANQEYAVVIAEQEREIDEVKKNLRNADTV